MQPRPLPLGFKLGALAALAIAALLLVGFLTKTEQIAAVNPAPCPTLVPVATATPDGGPTYTPTLTHTPCIIKLTSTPTITPTPTPPETAISLRVDVSQQTSCPGGPQPGEVCVPIGNKFDVIAVADAIPASGYLLAQTFIDYDSQGLVHKNASVALWPDCYLPTFLTTDDVANNAASAGCLSGFLSPLPISFHLGDLYSFSLTCSNVESSSDIQLLPTGHLIAGTNGKGTAFVDADSLLIVDPALTGITVSCVFPPHEFPDFDGDGCTWNREVGSDETQGGLRSDANPWDFYDVLGPGAALPLDQIIDLPNDILGVIQHFSPSGAAPYDVQFDRGPSAGPNPWDMTAPDGVIDLPNDVLGVIQQFNHSCQ